jgi:hypothetical protein
MNIGLIDVDNTAFPNLALMKLSAWHKKQGDTVEMYMPMMRFTYDKVYASAVFPTCRPKTNIDQIPSEALRGGPGFDLTTTLPDDVEHCCPDYSLYNIEDTAYGFSTRGCIRKCSFCIVPKKEGRVRCNADVSEFWNGEKNIILLDNNILAHSHGLKTLEYLASQNVTVDCNQGMDARLVTPEIAKIIASVKWDKIRFSMDHKDTIDAVKRAVTLTRRAMGKQGNFFCYVLSEDPDEAMLRVKECLDIKISPFVQPYREPGTWEISRENMLFARYCNRHKTLHSCTWAEFKAANGLK